MSQVETILVGCSSVKPDEIHHAKSWILIAVSLLLAGGATYRSDSQAETDHSSANASSLGISMMLYTFQEKSKVLVEKLMIGDDLNHEANFDPGRPTKILIHGFNMGLNYAEMFVAEYQKAESDYNVVAIDYSHLVVLDGYQSYYNASPYAISVGRVAGDLFVGLVRQLGLNPRDVHVIGYSLGSHVAAHFSRQIQRAGKGKVGRITSLDPARPWFEDNDPRLVLNRNDADFVDVIHTNGGSFWEGCFSWYDRLGHVDFYPNGGAHQPGCNELCLGSTCAQVDLVDMHGCSHNRALLYYVESINSPVGFDATLCDSWSSYKNGICADASFARMGEHCNESGSEEEGSYYASVNQHSPYATGKGSTSLEAEEATSKRNVEPGSSGGSFISSVVETIRNLLLVMLANSNVVSCARMCSKRLAFLPWADHAFHNLC